MRLHAIDTDKSLAGNRSPKVSLHGWPEQLGLTPRHVRTLFKKQTGMTFVAFLRDLRMRRAQKLLRATSQSVKEVALQSGYKNIESFCRDFKSITGCTPIRYRGHFRNRQ